MLKLTLVRHGQASFGSENYDQLSPLGYQQAQWLGEYFAQRELHFDRVVIGAMSRHQQTAEAIVQALPYSVDFEVHPGYNEYDFDALSDCFKQQYPDQIDTGYNDRRHFYAILKRALLAWSEDRLQQTPESWAEFNQRLQQALGFARQDDVEQVLVVSSGGAISALISQILGLDAPGMIQLNLQLRNTSISELIGNQSRSNLASFNHIPHLDIASRSDSISYS